MTSIVTNVDTADKLSAMFTENTGRSILDSGDAYGRAWERNQGLTTADFMSRPVASVDADGCISLNMFHYLRERLTYAPEMDSAWVAFDAERPDTAWSDSLSEWLDSLSVELDGDFYSDARWEFNTYNFDNMLDGTFQGVKFGVNGEWYFALQIHGGCDVRGGYTKPVIFTGEVESLVIDMNRAYLCCPECEFRASFDGDTLEDYQMPIVPASPDMLIEVDAETQLPADWEVSHGCPVHHVPLVA